MAPFRVAMIFMALPGWMRMHSRLPAGQSWGGAGRALHSPHITSHIVTAQYCGIAAIHRVTRCRPGVYLDTQIVRVTISTEIQHPSSEKAFAARGGVAVIPLRCRTAVVTLNQRSVAVWWRSGEAEPTRPGTGCTQAHNQHSHRLAGEQ